MANNDAFALKNSGFNSFLFSEVGTERNGSALTMLSALARLGQDPWSEAARWAKLPKSVGIERVAETLAQMPLTPEALQDAHETAKRLVLLLPRQDSVADQQAPNAVKLGVMPNWAKFAALIFALALGLVFNLTTHYHQDATPATPPAQELPFKL